MVRRWFENKSVLPTIEQGVAGITLRILLVAPAHDEKGHRRSELLRKIIIGVCKLGRLVRQNQYLASGIF